MVEGENRGDPEPENKIVQTFQGPSLAEDIRNSLDPRLIAYNFVTAGPCKPDELVRDFAATIPVMAGSLLLLQGIVHLHERLGFPNPGDMNSMEVLAWMGATLAMHGAVGHMRRRGILSF